MKRDSETSDSNSPKDIDTLYFPSELESEIGISSKEINFLKKKGCPFHGSKTTIRWIRTFLNRASGFCDLEYQILQQSTLLKK